MNRRFLNKILIAASLTTAMCAMAMAIEMRLEVQVMSPVPLQDGAEVRANVTPSGNPDQIGTTDTNGQIAFDYDASSPTVHADVYAVYVDSPTGTNYCGHNQDDFTISPDSPTAHIDVTLNGC